MGSDGLTMRVLVLHSRYDWRGGEDRLVDTVVEAFRRYAPEVELETFFPANKDFLPLKAAQNGVGLASTWPTLKAKIESFKPDVIHLHNPFFGLGLEWLWHLPAGPKVVMTLHNHRWFCTNALELREGRECTDCRLGFGLRPVTRNCNGSRLKSLAYWAALSRHRAKGTASKIHRFLTPSEYIKRVYEEAGWDPAILQVVRNPVDDRFFEAGLRARAGGPTCGKIGYLGRISEEKGILDFIELARQMPKERFVVIGDGPLKELCRAPNLEVLASVAPDEVAERVAGLKVLVAPSRVKESFGLAPLEALVLGVPVVASTAGALAELPIDPRFAFAPGDLNQLRAALKAALNSESSRTAGLDSFRPQAHVQEIVSVYKTLMYELN